MSITDSEYDVKSSAIKSTQHNDSTKMPSVTNVIASDQTSTLKVIPESSKVEKELANEANKGLKKPIEELNKTMTLMKKIEETQSKATKVTKTDGTDVQIAKDKQQVLTYKNLPSIRGKLTSIKTKW